jgi:hypothetical protein
MLPPSRLSFLIFLLVLFFAQRLPAQIGALDPSFSPPQLLNGAAPGSVRALTVQTGDQVIIAGTFTTVGVASRGNIARLNVDGTLDASFAAGAGANGPIYALSTYGDGRLLIAGDFTEVDGTPRNRIARLTPAGALDATFNPGSGFNGPVYALLQSSGAIYAGGDFTQFNGVNRGRIAVLSQTGALNSQDFNGGANGAVLCIASASFSDLIVGGTFTTFSGLSRNRLAKLRSSVALDSSVFTEGADGPVYGLTGVGGYPEKAYVAGDFSIIERAVRGRVARCSTETPRGLEPPVDGGPNFFFNAACRTFHSASSGLYIAGDFTAVNGFPRGRLARLSVGPTGETEFDTTFGNFPGTDGTIYAVATTPDGKPYIGGAFQNVTVRLGLASRACMDLREVFHPRVPRDWSRPL